MEPSMTAAVSQVKQMQDRIFDKLLRETGVELTGSQGRILLVLWEENHLTMGEISKRTALAGNTLSVVVEGMEQKGLVEREKNPENRRQIVVSLTDHARTLQGRYETVGEQVAEITYSDFTRDEIPLFEDLIERARQNLKFFEEEGFEEEY